MNTFVAGYLRNTKYLNKLRFEEVLPFVDNNLLKEWVETTLINIAFGDYIDYGNFFQKFATIRPDGLISMFANAIKMNPALFKKYLKEQYLAGKLYIPDHLILAVYYNNALAKDSTYDNRQFAPATHPVDTTYCQQMAMLGWDAKGTSLVALESVLPAIIKSNTIYIRYDLLKEVEYQLNWATVPTSGNFVIRIELSDGTVVDTQPIPILSGSTHPSIVIRFFIERALENLDRKISAYVCGKFSGASRWSKGSYKDGFGIRLLTNDNPDFCETIRAKVSVLDSPTASIKEVIVNAWCDHLDKDGNQFTTDDLISTYGLSFTKHAAYAKQEAQKWTDILYSNPAITQPIDIFIDFEDGFGFFDLKNRKISNILNQTYPGSLDSAYRDYDSWEISSEKAQNLQRILNESRATYLREIVSPIVNSKNLNIRFVGNYDHRYFCQTHPQGWLSDRSNCGLGVGVVVGNCQMKPLYGGFEPIETMDDPLKFGVTLQNSNSAIPQDRVKVKSIQQIGNEITITTYDDPTIVNSVGFIGLVPGSKIWLEDQRNVIPSIVLNPTTTLMEVNSISADGLTIKVRSPKIQDTPVVSNIPYNASTNVWVNVHHPWNTFVNAVNRIAQMSLTSNIQKGVFISSKKWLLDYRDSLLYEEMLLHALFRDCKLVMWNSDTTKTNGGPKDPTDDSLVNDILSYYNSIAGTGEPVELSQNFNLYSRQSDPYVLSGIRLGKRRLWRLTLNSWIDLVERDNKIFLYDNETVILELHAKVLHRTYGGYTLVNTFDPDDVPSLFFR